MTIYVPMKKICPTCNGEQTRQRPGSDSDETEDCHTCGGTGEVDSRTSKAAAQKALRVRGQR